MSPFGRFGEFLETRWRRGLIYVIVAVLTAGGIFVNIRQDRAADQSSCERGNEIRVSANQMRESIILIADRYATDINDRLFILSTLPDEQPLRDC